MRGLKFTKVVLSISVFLTLSVGIILSATAQLPNPGIEINPNDTALVITTRRMISFHQKESHGALSVKVLRKIRPLKTLGSYSNSPKKVEYLSLSHPTITIRQTTVGSLRVRLRR